KAERLAVEAVRSGQVLDGHPDEVDALGVDHPTEPSIWSWISRFISTAYSSGSSFVIGSTKPETIIAEASASERPRDIREKSWSSAVLETGASGPGGGA